MVLKESHEGMQINLINLIYIYIYIETRRHISKIN